MAEITVICPDTPEALRASTLAAVWPELVSDHDETKPLYGVAVGYEPRRDGELAWGLSRLLKPDPDAIDKLRVHYGTHAWIACRIYDRPRPVAVDELSDLASRLVDEYAERNNGTRKRV